jgi:hypothetical protein
VTALGASPAAGLVASVSQPASANAQAVTSTTRAAKTLRNFTTTDCISRFFKDGFLLIGRPGGGGYLPEKFDMRNGNQKRVSQLRG